MTKGDIQSVTRISRAVGETRETLLVGGRNGAFTQEIELRPITGVPQSGQQEWHSYEMRAGGPGTQTQTDDSMVDYAPPPPYTQVATDLNSTPLSPISPADGGRSSLQPSHETLTEGVTEPLNVYLPGPLNPNEEQNVDAHDQFRSWFDSARAHRSRPTLHIPCSRGRCCSAVADAGFFATITCITVTIVGGIGVAIVGSIVAAAICPEHTATGFCFFKKVDTRSIIGQSQPEWAHLSPPSGDSDT